MRIYFAAPFTLIAKPHPDSKEYGWVSNEFTDWLDYVINGLEAQGHMVHNPHRDDHKWGKAFPTLDELIPKQHKKITQDTDLFLAYLGEPQSGGVCIEMGYAIDNNIRTIIIKKPNEKITAVAYGLHKITPCEIIDFNSDEELVNQLTETLSKL